MRILIIGGSGFIGSFLTPQLMSAGHDVAVFRRASRRDGDAHEILGDRRRLGDSAAALRAFAPDVVVDAILSSGTQARDLMTLFAGYAGRVVALSSGDVYRACGVLHGLEPGPLEPVPLTETSPLRTKLQTYPTAVIRRLQGVFGWLDDEYDKIPVEREVLSRPDPPGTILRLPMVYGPGDRLHRSFPVLKRIADGRPALLFDETMAAFRSPRGYVENVAAAIALAATTPGAAGQIFNVAESESFSELDWAREIARLAGWSGEFVVLPPGRAPAHLRPPGNFAQHWVMDSTKIRTELKYREPIGRDEALRRTIEWERANPPADIDAAQFDYAAEDTALARR